MARSRVAALAAFAAVAFAPWVLDSYDLSLVSGWLYLAIAVLSLTLLVGLGGQLSVGHAAFIGVGAYVLTILMSDYGLSLWLAGLAAIVITGAVGAVVSLPALRLSGFYIILPTIGLAMVFPTWLVAGEEFTGGSVGRSLSRPILAPAWTGLQPHQWVFFITLAATAVLFWAVGNIKNSRTGRSLRAVRDNEAVAETFGVRLASTKVLVSVVSASIAGVAGCLFALQRQFVSPHDFSLVLAISLFAAMAVGGQFSVPGAMIGGAFLQYAQRYLGDTGMVDPVLVPFLYGALLIAIVLWFSDGLAPALGRGLRHVVKRVAAVLARRPRPEARG